MVINFKIQTHSINSLLKKIKFEMAKQGENFGNYDFFKILRIKN